MDIGQYQDYANVLNDVEASQASLLLSTQGLTNAEIQQVLAQKNLTKEEQYQALSKAGLLKSTQSITVAELQETLQSQLGSQAKAEETLKSMGLSAAIEGEEQQTVELTAKKIQLAVASGKLTEAEALELAMHLNIDNALNAQNESALPQWLANLKNTGTALKKQAVDTLNWAKALPVATKALAGVGVGIGVAIAAYSAYKNHLEEVRQATVEAATAYQESASSIDDYVSKYQELYNALLAAKGNEEETYEIKNQLLELQTELNDKYGDEYEKLNLVTDAYENQTKAIKGLSEAEANKFLNENVKGIQDATDQMEKERNYILSSTMVSLDTPEGKELEKIINSYADKGMYVVPSGDGTVQIHLNANAEDAYEVINDFETDLRNKAKALGQEHIFDGIITFSSNALTDANDIIEKYGEIYNQAQMANLVVDEDSSAIYEKALSAVEEYNDAVMASEDPFNDENVAKAKANVEATKAEADELGKFGTIFKDVFAQAVKLPGEEALDSLFEDIAQRDGKNVVNMEKWVQDHLDRLGINTEEEVIAFHNLYLELDNFNSALDAWGKRAGSATDATGELADETKSFVEVASGVNGLTKGFDQLDSIYADLIDGEDFDSGNFLNNDSFKETFGNLTDVTDEYKDAYDDFIREVSNSNGKLTSGVQNAFDKLATAYIEHETALDEVTEETRAYTEAQLEQMGVSNAKQVVDERIIANTNAQAIQEQYLAQTGQVLLDQSWAQISAFLNEAGASEVAYQALALLKLEQMDLANNPIDLSSNISEILTLAKAAKVSAQHVEALQELLTMQNSLDKMAQNGYSDSAAYKQLENRFNVLADKINSASSEFTDVDIEFTPVKYTGGINSLAAAQENLADATDKATDALEKQKEVLEGQKSEYEELHDAIIEFYDDQIEAIDEKIEAIEEENEALEEQLDNMDDIIKAIEDNYDAEIDKIQEKIDALQDENDEEERALKLEEAKRKLAEAKSRKTVLQYEAGKGFVYTVNTNAIKEATQELEDLQDEEVIHQLEEEIDKLEEAKQKWSEIPEAYEKAMRELAAKNYFGSDWRTTTLFPSDELFNKFKGEYTGTQKKIDENERRIEKLENEKSYLEDLKELWEDAIDEYEKQQRRAKLESFFGSDYEYQLLNNSSMWRQQFVSEYSAICAEIESLEERIKSANDSTATSATENAETTKTAYENTATAVEDSVARIQKATSDVDGGIDEVTNELVDSTSEKLAEIETVVTTLDTYIGNLKDKIATLYDAMQKMDEITLSNVIAAFGGASGEDSGQGSDTESSSDGKSDSGNGTGLLKAVNDVKDAIGEPGEGDESGSGLLGLLNQLDNQKLENIIGKFGSETDEGGITANSLLLSIQNVSDAIAGEDNETSLLASIETLSEDSIEPIDNVNTGFRELLETITQCVLKVDDLVEAINSIDISGINGIVNPSGGASGTAYATASTYAVGNAYSSGTSKWGLTHDEPNALISELGSEILIRDGKHYLIDKPTFMDLKKGDIIFNHKQTKAILDNGKKSVVDQLNNQGLAFYKKIFGESFGDGTVNAKFFDSLSKSLPESFYFTPPNVNYLETLQQMNTGNDKKEVSISIGDIHVHGVQDVDGFAKKVVNEMPMKVIQAINQRNL